jgi:hypothetical protein
MSQTTPVAYLQIASIRRPADSALDDALLKHTSLLSTLISGRVEVRKEPVLGQAELMRLVESQQSLLSASRELPHMRRGAKNGATEPSFVQRLAA